MKRTTVLTICMTFGLVLLSGCCKDCPPINPPGTVVWKIDWLAGEKCSLTVHLAKNLDGGGGKPCYPEGSCGATVDAAPGYYYAWVECQGTRYYYNPCLDIVRVPNERPKAPNVAVIPTDTLLIHIVIKPD